MTALIAAMCEDGCTVGDGIAILGLSFAAAAAIAAVVRWL